MGQITVFSGPERRRRWSDEERLEILNQAFAPGACVAEVCRRYDATPGFTAVVMIEDVQAARSHLPPAIVIDLARGKRISIFSSASPSLVASALKALR